MNGIEVYRYYLALKFHFTSNYDFRKYSGKVKQTIKYDKSKEKPWCESIAKRYGKKSPTFLLANLSKNPTYYIRDIATLPECEDNYKQWRKNRQKSIHLLKSDLKKLKDFSSEIKPTVYDLPLLMKRYLRQEISKESLCIILKTKPDILFEWNTILKNNTLWKQEKRSIEKYITFIPDKMEYTEIIDCFVNKKEV